MTESAIQTFWATDLTVLDGVGEKLAERLSELIGGRTLGHLLFHKPHRWAERSAVDQIDGLLPDQIQTVVAEVQNVSLAGRGSKLQKVRLIDDSGFLTLVFFNSNAEYLKRQYPVGRKMAVSGLVEDFHGQRQMTHPDYAVIAEKISEIPLVEPIYPLTAGITTRRVHSLIVQTLKRLPGVSDWLDPVLKTRHDWPSFADALHQIHAPEKFDQAAIDNALERLAYDEALSRALAFRIHRNSERAADAQPLSGFEQTERQFISNLPYAPTSAQARAFQDIANDLAQSFPMQRMLQGDVGSGKTTVAAFACALAAANTTQTAVMAPTEVLARQLYRSISEVLTPLGIKTECLTGGTKTSERRRILEEVAAGDIDVLCGTHALFQDKVEFRSLSLVIIDEQHRFGVNDRARLAAKGISPHLLIMSATPIPRSLAMTIHGDVDLSILDEKPAGRKPIDTRTIPDARLDQVIAAVGRAIADGEQAFWVCPRVDDEEDGVSAVARYAMLDDIYEQRVGLVHGRLSSDEKAKALEDFRTGETAVLIATTVIEVGVDVPNATIMVIEGAERFGLAQLHQLRGRVGRGSKKSHCLLVYAPPLGETAKTRLDTLRKSEDGFHIAEVDFELRGPGDILGLAQSGLPDFRFLDLSRHQSLLAISQKDAAVRLGDTSTTLSDSEADLVSLFRTKTETNLKV